MVAYYPRSYLASSNAPPRIVPIDLSPLGAAFAQSELRASFIQWPEKSLGTVSGYNVFSDVQDALKLHQNKLSDVTYGVREAETFYGFRPRETVHNIFIQNSGTENAYVQPTERNTVVVTSAKLENNYPSGSNRNWVVLGRHEAFHSLSILPDGSLLSDGVFQAAHSKARTRSFALRTMREHLPLEQLDEELFYPLDMPAGHSFDNAEEAFASLMNSLHHPEWTKRIDQASPAFREIYASLLVAAQTNVQTAIERGFCLKILRWSAHSIIP